MSASDVQFFTPASLSAAFGVAKGHLAAYRLNELGQDQIGQTGSSLTETGFSKIHLLPTTFSLVGPTLLPTIVKFVKPVQKLPSDAV